MASSGMPTCSTSSFESAHFGQNSLKQSSCFVAITLARQCKPNYTLDPLPVGVGNSYSSIGFDEADQCVCNTVFYSMSSACAWCQDAGIRSWSEYSFNCPRSILFRGIRQWPGEIPEGIAIPPWAYGLDPASDDLFDPLWLDFSRGSDSTRLPESTLPLSTDSTTVQPTSTQLSTGSNASGSATVGASTTADANVSPDRSSADAAQNTDGGSVITGTKKINVGAIVGGAVGGFLVLLLLCFVVLWIIRRKKRATRTISAEKGVVIGPSPPVAIAAYSSIPVLSPVMSDEPPLQTIAPTNIDEPELEPPPYQPSEVGSSITQAGSSQSGLLAASAASGSSYPSEKGSQVFLRPYNP